MPIPDIIETQRRRFGVRGQAATAGLPREVHHVIKVLIVDDIPETRDHLTKLLSFEEGIDVAGDAGSGEEAITKAMELRPTSW